MANQATEYVYNKNKTEGKTGVIKPDLIPQEKRAASGAESKKSKESPKKTESSPKKLQVDAKKIDNLEHITKELSSKSTPEKSKLSKDTDKFIKTEKLDMPAKTADTTATTSATDNANSASPKSHQSPSKTRAKPTEIKKPGVIDTGRFKTVKSATTATAAESSELEKIAAAKLAEKSKLKSPNSQDADKTEITSNASQANKALVTSSTLPETLKTEQKPNIISTTVPALASTSTNITAKSDLTAAADSANSSAPSAIRDNAKRPSLIRHKDSLTECKPLNVLVYAETSTAKESAVSTLKEILADNT